MESGVGLLREESEPRQGEVSTDMKTIRFALAATLLIAATAAAQDDPPAGRGGRGGGARGAWQGPMDTIRARQLYVSRNPADLRGCAQGLRACHQLTPRDAVWLIEHGATLHDGRDDGAPMHDATERWLAEQREVIAEVDRLVALYDGLNAKK